MVVAGPASKSPSSTCFKRIGSAFPKPNPDQEHLLKNNNSLGKNYHLHQMKIIPTRCLPLVAVNLVMNRLFQLSDK